jgi:hypothetical protein
MMAEDHLNGDIVLPFSPAQEEITVIVGKDQKKVLNTTVPDKEDE